MTSLKVTTLPPCVDVHSSVQVLPRIIPKSRSTLHGWWRNAIFLGSFRPFHRACDKMPQNVSVNGGLSSIGAVWCISQIQELALSHGCAAPCREPLLIGNLPRAYFLAPLRVLLPNATCT